MTNEIYTGTLVNFKRKKISFRSKRFVPNDAAKILRTEDRFPVVISKELFALVQEVRSKNYRASHTYHKEFTNLIFCGDCGKKMILRKQGNNKYKEQYYFHCAKDNGGCGGHYFRLEMLKELIFNDFKNMLDKVVTTSYIAVISMLNHLNLEKKIENQILERKQLERTKKRLQELQFLISTLLETYSKHLLPEDSYQSLLKEYKKEYVEQTIKEKALSENIGISNISEFEKTSRRQLDSIIALETYDLFEGGLLRKIISSIKIYDTKKENQTIRTIQIKYCDLGILKGTLYGQ